jgi:hypothetical protein
MCATVTFGCDTPHPREATYYVGYPEAMCEQHEGGARDWWRSEAVGMVSDALCSAVIALVADLAGPPRGSHYAVERVGREPWLV